MLNHEYLLLFLEEVDKQLKGKITLIAVGGTAMTLLNLKSSTLDIDFTGPTKHINEFNRILKFIPHGIKIDTWKDGNVFIQQLPSDYVRKSIPIHAAQKRGIKKIDLRALNPIDIIATKIGRLIDRDLQDIEICFNRYMVKRVEFLARTKEVKKSYVGNKETYQMNLDTVISLYGNLLT
jgi:hypothetical protein